MTNLDIEFAKEIINGVRSLAVDHYGDGSEASISRVVESALKMRLLSMILVEGGGNEIEEPVTDWEFANKQPAEQLPEEIRSWLFRKGGS
jgi:hypothetical protein